MQQMQHMQHMQLQHMQQPTAAASTPVGGTDAAAIAAAAAAAVTAGRATLCGFAWSDVQRALMKAVAEGDGERAQRWAAELVCTPSGLGRLEAAVLEAWAVHVGAGTPGAIAAPGWPARWGRAIATLRSSWERGAHDVAVIRNMPGVRAAVADSVAHLAAATPKAPLPALPPPAACYAELESVKARLRSPAVRARQQPGVATAWVPGEDAEDLRLLGNEFEACLRGGQTGRALFWLVWFLSLDAQPDRPACKARVPTTLAPLPARQRASLAWFVVDVLLAVLRGAPPAVAIVAADAGDALRLLPLVWTKLGAKGRRDVLTAATLAAAQVANAVSVVASVTPAAAAAQAATALRSGEDAARVALTRIDAMYARIASDAAALSAAAAAASDTPGLHITPAGAAGQPGADPRMAGLPGYASLLQPPSRR